MTLPSPYTLGFCSCGRHRSDRCRTCVVADIAREAITPPPPPTTPLSPIELELIERIEAKTVVTKCGCWEWRGSTVNNYGVISYLNEQHRIHRLVYSIYKGPLIPGEFVCHTCDNPPCWNIDHIWQGTPADNTQDMWAKDRQGKHKRGRKHGESWKLTPANVIHIRAQLHDGVSNRELAIEYNVSDVMISRIKLRKAWAWL